MIAKSTCHGKLQEPIYNRPADLDHLSEALVELVEEGRLDLNHVDLTVWVLDNIGNERLHAA